jgi:D-arabinan exo alpha-(1,3)/(1,5)-arabinofuranosidase (non-reducing end)
MRSILPAFIVLMGTTLVYGQSPSWMPDMTQQQTYTLHRSSSMQSTGGNADYRTVTPGQTLTLLDVDGPGEISHMWFTLSDGEPFFLKRIVLRIYWDGEESPSVEAPIGDFFGQGTGEYVPWQSEVLTVSHDRAMNSYFPMPYARHAKITITNDGKESLGSLYWNIDYRTDVRPLPKDILYFHAQYRQAQPNHGWTGQWYENGDPIVNYRRNPDGKDNYVWMEAQGHGQFVGVTMSILQNQDGWWGEGDDMFFVDGATTPTFIGTGSEDYFLGAWDFGGSGYSLPLNGAPLVGKEIAGSRWSVYRFHLDSPIPFAKSLKATIEHGHANHRSDTYSSVAYWYQAEPHVAFPPLPDVNDRVPVLQFVGGPGNSKGDYSPGSLTPR